mmetsp:Transcript_13197/g.22602  ORF Transcript_13197/g.22602 Transcript_13197/m.22602 type:complete len:207 (+) Transcript_13197:366-986(+)
MMALGGLPHEELREALPLAAAQRIALGSSLERRPDGRMERGEISRRVGGAAGNACDGADRLARARLTRRRKQELEHRSERAVGRSSGGRADVLDAHLQVVGIRLVPLRYGLHVVQLLAQQESQMLLEPRQERRRANIRVSDVWVGGEEGAREHIERVSHKVYEAVPAVREPARGEARLRVEAQIHLCRVAHLERLEKGAADPKRGR